MIMLAGLLHGRQLAENFVGEHDWATGMSQERLSCALATRAAAEIGDESGVEFGQIAGAAFLNDSTLSVGDGQANNVRFFTTSGKLISTVGKTGRAPGEFRSISSLSLHHDTVVVSDGVGRRVSLLTTGGFVRWFDSSATSGPSRFIALIGDKRLIVAHTNSRRRGANGPEIWRDSVELRLENSGQGKVLARIEDVMRIVDFTKIFGMIEAPFRPPSVIKAASNQIVIGEPNREIRRFKADGSALPSIPSLWRGELISPDAMQQWTEDQVGRFKEPDRPIVRGMLAIAKTPDRAPAYDAIALDRAGRIWIQEYRAPFDTRPSQVVAVDSNGKTILRGTLEGRGRLLAASRTMVAVRVKDENDVESVRLYRVSCN
ncbi:MAG: hypothetical protein WEE89_16310 [Gemmatimonadota bacterium]